MHNLLILLKFSKKSFEHYQTKTDTWISLLQISFTRPNKSLFTPIVLMFTQWNSEKSCPNTTTHSLLAYKFTFFNSLIQVIYFHHWTFMLLFRIVHVQIISKKFWFIGLGHKRSKVLFTHSFSICLTQFPSKSVCKNAKVYSEIAKMQPIAKM